MSKFKYSVQEVCVENSKYGRKNLKNMLFKFKLKEKKCEICGLGEEWNNKVISLTLDHINGIRNDNRLENLRILCPNCHSQTDTFASRNKQKVPKAIYYCKCGAIKKTKSSKLCFKCEIVNKRKVKRPELNILLKEVKELGYTKTGRKYGVSDNSIRKWVTHMVSVA